MTGRNGKGVRAASTYRGARRNIARERSADCVFEARDDSGAANPMASSGRAWCQTHGFDCPKLARTYEREGGWAWRGYPAKYFAPSPVRENRSRRWA